MKAHILIAICFCVVNVSFAQNLADIQYKKEPLILRSVGSFYVGGETEFQSQIELGGFSPEGHITINQMYVSYMVPQNLIDSTSFVFIHGMNLSGKTWETTPDGRMGWNEYFVRKGYPVYLVDQIGAGRSGFNQKNYNLMRAGRNASENQQIFQRISDENTWINFRFGLKSQQPVKEAKYPINAIEEFSKQSVPFAMFGLPEPNPNYLNLSTLAAELKNAVLVSHSQSGRFPLESALHSPKGIKAMVLLEPGGSGSNYTDEQIRELITIPLLVVFGDYLENETGIPSHSWKNYHDGWDKFVKHLNAAGGNARLIYLPDLGIRGNSHMLMQDTNNQQIADIILNWITDNK